MRRAQYDPATAAATLRDCGEILDVIMAGDVREWLGG
jgi:hypothetical protein